MSRSCISATDATKAKYIKIEIPSQISSPSKKGIRDELKIPNDILGYIYDENGKIKSWYNETHVYSPFLKTTISYPKRPNPFIRTQPYGFTSSGTLVCCQYDNSAYGPDNGPYTLIRDQVCRGNCLAIRGDSVWVHDQEEIRQYWVSQTEIIKSSLYSVSKYSDIYTSRNCIIEVVDNETNCGHITILNMDSQRLSVIKYDRKFHVIVSSYADYFLVGDYSKIFFVGEDGSVSSKTLDDGNFESFTFYGNKGSREGRLRKIDGSVITW